MKEPRTKKDVYVWSHPHAPHSFQIYTSMGAHSWIAEHAGEFGVLEWEPDGGYFTLKVNVLYKWREVYEYLATKGEGFPDKPHQPSILERIALRLRRNRAAADAAIADGAGEEAQPLTEESREYTTGEIRQQFLEQVWTIISYWHNLPAKTCREKMEGLAFSMLVILDGESAGLPAFIVAPVPHPNDKAFSISEDENFYPENHDANVKGDIAGPLHELFHNIRKSEGEGGTQS